MEIILNDIRKSDIDELSALLAKQVGFFRLHPEDSGRYRDSVEAALGRVRTCFSRLKNKYYQRGDSCVFAPGHTGQYAIFLYYLSHTLRHAAGEAEAASGVYALNKMLHNVDLYFDVALPEVFYLDHPLGTVIGRGTFSNYFQFRQNCTVGNNHGVFPVFGENVQMWSGVTVVGNCRIGDHVTLSAGTYVKDEDIPSYSLVFGRSPNLVIKEREPQKAMESIYFVMGDA